MEPKPIKRNIHIQQLSKDHHFTLLFCWKIRQGLKKEVSPERIKKYVAYFLKTHMLPHFREEEEILFAPVTDEKTGRAITEHHQIKGLIAETLQATDSTAKTLLTELADAVDNHVRYEERELFPHLEQTLSTAQLEGIGRQLGEQHAAVADDFEDEFWLTKKVAE